MQAEESDESFIIHESEASDGPKTLQGNRDSSEITYEFTIDAVPADFQNEKDEESDESIFFEETVILPAEPGIYDLPSPKKVPDLDFPKDRKVFSLPSHELHAELPLDKSTPKVNLDGGKSLREADCGLVEVEKPQEKEEFVLTFDELSNVDFSATDPNELKKVRRDLSDVPKVNYRITFRSSLDLDSEVEALPEDVMDQELESNDDMENFENGAKKKCSELSFTPDYEGEDEDMLEEKSISLINLPAKRTPVNDSETINGAATETYASSTKIVLSSQSPSSQISEISPRKDDSIDSNSLMQAQYNQLQQQFTMWQSQLIQNQKLLASHGASDFSSQMIGKDDQSNLQLQQLQLQIQMQQQMMLQLQQSMQALALQNTLASQQQTLTQNVSQPLVATGTLQTQQTPPPPVSTQIFTASNEKYRPPSPEEETHKEQVAPVAPAPPAITVSKSKSSKADAKYSKPKQKRFERELDPREQLMLDIRNFGKKRLNKVGI